MIYRPTSVVVMGLPARGGPGQRRVQPRQTDAVDQFVAREANGYKAEGFSRQSFMSMNHSEEASLSGTAVPESSYGFQGYSLTCGRLQIATHHLTGAGATQSRTEHKYY